MGSDPGNSALWKTIALFCMHYGIILAVIYLPKPISMFVFGAGLESILFLFDSCFHAAIFTRMPLAGIIAVHCELCGLVNAEVTGGIANSLSVLLGAHLTMLFCSMFLNIRTRILTSFVIHIIIVIIVPIVAPVVITIPELPHDYQGESLTLLYFAANADNPAFYVFWICILIILFPTLLSVIRSDDFEH